jgi:hypothetical protein
MDLQFKKELKKGILLHNTTAATAIQNPSNSNPVKYQDSYEESKIHLNKSHGLGGRMSGLSVLSDKLRTL